MNALANDQVGELLERHFVASFLKIGTFAVVNGNKQGGNVASYFCTSNGQVLHALAGPVNADTLLREARWVVDAWKLAKFEGRASEDRCRDVLRRAHAERLLAEHGMDRRNLSRLILPRSQRESRALVTGSRIRHSHLSNQGKVHYLLIDAPLVNVADFYKVVFEEILNEKVSTLPVTVN